MSQQNVGTSVREVGKTPDGRRVTTEWVSRDGRDGEMCCFVYEKNGSPTRIWHKPSETALEVAQKKVKGEELKGFRY